MSTDNNNNDNVPTENSSEGKSAASVPDKNQTIEGATPLTTYEAINTDATIVTRSTIEERIAKTTGGKSTGPLAHFQTERSAAKDGQQADRSSDRSRDRGNRNDKGERGPARNNRSGSNRRNNNEETEGFARFDKPNTVDITPRLKPELNFKQRFDEDEEEELNAFLDGKAFEHYLEGVDNIAGQEIFESGTKVKAKIISILPDCVFVDIGSREQGSIPLKQFPEDTPPALGQVYDAVVTKYDADEGFYEVALPLAALEIGDWSSVDRGMIVEAKVTGLNKGGLDCEVGHIRAFLPISQISLVRVENAEMFIGERWKCIVTESNPDRRNLVISRRAVLEMERAEMREKLMAELEAGQIRDGVVRRLIDAGAFVDLGGVDGFIPISAMSWGRIQHPSAVLSEGDRVRVKVVKIDEERNRISLSLRDETSDPWNSVDDEYEVGNLVRGRIVNIKPYGAFVELKPGVDGFVHISEISYNRIGAVSDVLKEGEWVDAKIIAIDPTNRKLSLSIKQCGEDPNKKQEETEENKEQAEPAPEEPAKPAVQSIPEQPSNKMTHKKGPLLGGFESDNGGEKFGLKW